ncbi:golgin subfamily A member 6-like protein 22 [Palaemon carinicauda]|uniref:golgin subfamily A member 6-like protein 22 n=1 Tax=Palaemon carinicauda TaxID=392227 RepID=UPI0035B6A39B
MSRNAWKEAQETQRKDKDRCERLFKDNIGVTGVEVIETIRLAGNTEEDRSKDKNIKQECERIIRNLNEEEALMILGDFNGHVGFLGYQNLDRNEEMILDWMNDHGKLWKKINRIRNRQKAHGKVIQLYEEQGSKLNKEKTKEELVKYWKTIYYKHENKIDSVWNEEKRIEYENEIAHQEDITRIDGYNIPDILREHYELVMLLSFMDSYQPGVGSTIGRQTSDQLSHRRPAVSSADELSHRRSPIRSARHQVDIDESHQRVLAKQISTSVREKEHRRRQMDAMRRHEDSLQATFDAVKWQRQQHMDARRPQDDHQQSSFDGRDRPRQQQADTTRPRVDSRQLTSDSKRRSVQQQADSKRSRDDTRQLTIDGERRPIHVSHQSTSTSPLHLDEVIDSDRRSHSDVNPSVQAAAVAALPEDELEEKSDVDEPLEEVSENEEEKHYQHAVDLRKFMLILTEVFPDHFTPVAPRSPP